MDYINIRQKVSETLVKASTCFSDDKIEAYKKAIDRESNSNSKWVLENILENAIIAKNNKSPLCDDTGIPHLFLEVGKEAIFKGSMVEAIYDGVKDGLESLPGRPMAVKGDVIERIEQSRGLDEKSSAVEPAPIAMKYVEGDKIRLYILMLGGGPAIRGKSYRIFHKHNIEIVKNEIIDWATEAVRQLGCTPCTLAIGIGRSHYEASCKMLEAQVYGRYDVQSKLEKEITKRINESKIGALGLHGDTTVLATFLNVAQQRASGVRIVCIRPCCCFEPRIASVEI